MDDVACSSYVLPPPYYCFPVIPSMKRRAVWHDYSKRGLYMLTIVTKDRRPLFGSIVDGDEPYVKFTELGAKIYYNETKRIHSVYPNVDVWRKCVMPDHIHLIVYVSEDMPEGTSLGSVVGGFKTGINQIYRYLSGRTGGTIFEEGYNDKILYGKDTLKKWKQYLKENPLRLALKKRHPSLFIVRRGLMIADMICECVGNSFLLEYPDRKAVIVRSAWSLEYYALRKRAWLRFAANGGVLVSAAIHPLEREVLHEAFEMGAKVIWLRDRGFPNIYKPSGRAFYSCAEGRLLQISPWQYTTQRHAITREQCCILNNMASKIAGEPVQFCLLQ